MEVEFSPRHCEGHRGWGQQASAAAALCGEPRSKFQSEQFHRNAAGTVFFCLRVFLVSMGLVVLGFRISTAKSRSLSFCLRIPCKFGSTLFCLMFLVGLVGAQENLLELPSLWWFGARFFGTVWFSICPQQEPRGSNGFVFVFLGYHVKLGSTLVLDVFFSGCVPH